MAERGRSAHVEELATSAADDVVLLAVHAVTQENVEGHDGGGSEVRKVSRTLVLAECVEDREVEELSERELDVELARRTRRRLGWEFDAVRLGAVGDVETTEGEGVLAAVERSLAQRLAEIVGVQGNEGVPDGDTRLAVDSRRRTVAGATRRRILRADLGDSNVVVGDRRGLLELEAVEVGDERNGPAKRATLVRALRENWREAKTVSSARTDAPTATRDPTAAKSGKGRWHGTHRLQSGPDRPAKSPQAT